MVDDFDWTAMATLMRRILDDYRRLESGESLLMDGPLKNMTVMEARAWVYDTFYRDVRELLEDGEATGVGLEDA